MKEQSHNSRRGKMRRSPINKDVDDAPLNKNRSLSPEWLKILSKRILKGDSWDEKESFLTSSISVLKKAVEDISLVVVTGPDGEVTYASEEYIQTMQFDQEEIVGKSYFDRIDVNTMNVTDCTVLTTAIKEGYDIKVESRHQKKNGSLAVLETAVFPLVHSGMRFANLILHQDITPLKEAEETIKELVTVDVLTGLKNRKQFELDLQKMITSYQSLSKSAAVLFIDLDRFKYYNDTLGHFTGDKLIEEISKELVLFENSQVSVYRYGGDEFTILMRNEPEREAVESVARKVLARFQKPFLVLDNELFITATVGISLYPETGVASTPLVQQSEIAMQHAKERGKNHYQVYETSLRTKRDERLRIEKRLRKATENQQFQLYYQPQVDLKENKVVGFEALLRWNDEKLGDVSPGVFIPIAEDSGLIFPIGDWVLEQACYQAKQWYDKGFSTRMGINISPKQFQRPDFVGKVKNIIEKTGVNPSLLDLEITENDLLYNRDECFKTLKRLKDIGIQISIDDFGTGYSSLSYLRRFPIDTLKIDQSFIREVIENTNDQAIVTSIIQLAHNMNMRVIAEGVETAEMVMFLNERNCDEMQGFLYSKALPADNVMDFVNEKEPTAVLHS